MSQKVNMVYPDNVLEEVDRFKNENGFQTRTQTILYLIQYAMRDIEKKNESK